MNLKIVFLPLLALEIIILIDNFRFVLSQLLIYVTIDGTLRDVASSLKWFILISLRAMHVLSFWLVQINKMDNGMINQEIKLSL